MNTEVCKTETKPRKAVFSGVQNKGAKEAETLTLRAVRRTAQERSQEAIDRLTHWMRSENPKASIAACVALLDRAFGKPVQPVASDADAGSALALIEGRIRLVPVVAITQPVDITPQPIPVETDKVVDNQ